MNKKETYALRAVIIDEYFVLKFHHFPDLLYCLFFLYFLTSLISFSQRRNDVSDCLPSLLNFLI